MDGMIRTFDCGELSPQMEGRTELAQYHRGARQVQNMAIQPTGGAVRRPGFERINGPGSDYVLAELPYATRLIPFVKGTTRYLLAVTESEILVFKSTST